MRNRQARPFDPRRYPALQQLNAITAAVFSGIGRSPVPVLLPFDAPAYLANRIAGAPDLAETPYQSGFRRADLFEAGPSGYDAVFSLPPHAGDGLRSRVYSRPIEVHITGSLLTYDIGDRGKGEPVKSLANQYPDLRRLIREGFVRYAFTRFGVPYVVSINCLDSVPRSRRLACREASLSRRAFPEKSARDRRQADARASLLLHKRSSARRRLHRISPTVRPATSSTIRAIAARAARPTGPSIRRSASRSKRRPPSPIRNPS